MPASRGRLPNVWRDLYILGSLTRESLTQETTYSGWWQAGCNFFWELSRRDVGAVLNANLIFGAVGVKIEAGPGPGDGAPVRPGPGRSAALIVLYRRVGLEVLHGGECSSGCPRRCPTPGYLILRGYLILNEVSRVPLCLMPSSDRDGLR